MKTNIMKTNVYILIFSLVTIIVYSQDNRIQINKINKKFKSTIKMSASLHAMLYYRGIPLSALFTDRKVPTPTLVGSASYQRKHFSIGIWMANSIDSQGLKNASINVGYTFGNFDIRIWDYYTYAGRPSQDLNFFDYDKQSTKHFIDLVLLYKLKETPITFLWGTVIHGSDDGSVVNGNFENRYSTYFRVDYTTKEFSGVAADFHISMGGALNNIDNRYFTALHKMKSFNVVDVGVNFLKTVKITETYSIPLLVGVVASPINNRFDGVININLF